ncbi:glycosyltransferase family 2 protein [Autumnicola edwardsiae]|uniref:Glycosyltransferase family 2 protein n=1 Tax=Autumnicola edwardsiae TaxID=3075594 RepID=A0ABU3CVX8_9FLAO|nr:glycosyltransferase family 2 protein [Zunongwangia sp. F297]MDT0650426.1 glycosyltransferase family 2 protein [Zunongwangia sp. F297]
MKISICIPTYNRPDLLKEAINSCIEQTYLPDEIIVCDDSTNDESKLLIESFQNQTHININYMKNNPPLGQAANVNKLFATAKGEKIVLLHDDDLLIKTALEKMISTFEADHSIDAVYGKQYIINEDGVIDEKHSEHLNAYYFRTSYYSENRLSPLEAGMVQQFPNDCYMLNKAVINKVHYRNKSQIGHAGDFDFGFQLGVQGYNLHFINEYTAKYRITKSSVARNGTDSGYQAFKIIRQAGIAGKSKKTDPVNVVLRRKAPVAILQAAKKGEKKEALNIYFSKWHRSSILTLGGMRRMVNILF